MNGYAVSTFVSLFVAACLVTFLLINLTVRVATLETRLAALEASCIEVCEVTP